MQNNPPRFLAQWQATFGGAVLTLALNLEAVFIISFISSLIHAISIL
jgi:hypothetical protein